MTTTNGNPKPIRNIVISFEYSYPSTRALEFKQWLLGKNNTKVTVRHNTKSISGRIRQLFIYDWDTKHLTKAMNWLGRGASVKILNQSLYH